jgi:CubicO group peptidase (beta-lactamase class C family)
VRTGALSQLERLVHTTQAEARVPALSVALHRTDRPLWTLQVGTSGHPEMPLGQGTLFRMGSVTKTFTAVLVLQCRDDGLLDLDDPVSTHLPLPAHGDMTIRRLLSHTAGLQREPHGDAWDTLRMPDAERLISDLVRVERVLPPSRRFHYSNLGVSLLGHMVGRLRGGTWWEVLQDRVLRPLKLTDVTVDAGDRAAIGYLVDAYSDHARPERTTDLGAVAPAGQLWASAADLAKWAAFLADPGSMDRDGQVLSAATLEEMRWPVTVTDDTAWGGGFGLGLLLVPQPDRVVHVGHDGAMPGFLAGAYGRIGGVGTPAACGAAVLGSSGTAVATVELPHKILQLAVSEDPADVVVWRPGEPPPEAYRSVLGRWWSEGFEYVFTWRGGALRAMRVDTPDRPESAFEPLAGEGDLRTTSGRETGERLRLTRDPATGDVIRMHWATYRFTRSQETFGGTSASAP